MARRKRKVSAPVEEPAELSEQRAGGESEEEPAPSTRDGEDSGEEEDRGRTPPPKAKAAKRRKTSAAAAAAEAAVTAETASLSLLDVCKEHPGEVETAAAEWVNWHEEDQVAATAELLTFIVQAAGSTREVSPEDAEGEVDALVSAVKGELVAEGYVELLRGRSRARFVAAYLRCWDALLQAGWARGALAGRGLLLERVCHLLIGLSSSDVRPLRYAATLTACHLATGLVRRAAVLGRERELAQRQAAAEGARRKQTKEVQERAAAFARTAAQHHSQVSELQGHVGGIFQGITTSRFRDRDEAVRATVIDGLGNWAALRPGVYLEDLYVKYFAWGLCDRAPTVREAAADALIAVLSDSANLAAMAVFVDRFAPRFLQLPADADDAVAVKGVKLLALLVKVEKLPYEQVSDAFRLLLEEGEALREAAAGLVGSVVEAGGRQRLLHLQEAARGRRRSADAISPAEAQLAGLLHVMQLLGEGQEAEQRKQLAARLADALFDRVPALCDWRAMADSLLDDSACELRGPAATTDLALLLAAAADRACGPGAALSSQTARRGRGRPRAAAAAAAAAASETDHPQELTLAMSRSLLKLLRKHQADPVAAGALASLLPRLKLAIFSLKRDEKGLEAILKAIASLLGKHAAPAAAGPCLAALAHAANPGGVGPQHPAEAIFKEAAGQLIGRFAEAAEQLLSLDDAELAVESAADLDGACEEAFECHAGLARVRALLLASPLAAQEPAAAKGLAALLQAAADGRPLPERLLGPAAEAQALLLLWQGQQTLAQGRETPAGLGAAAAAFAQTLQGLLARVSGDGLRASLALCLADLLQGFRPAAFQAAGVRRCALRGSAAQAQALWRAAEALANEADSSPESAEAAGRVLGALGRLVLCEVEPFASLLPGRVASFLGSSDAGLAGVARDTLAHLKRSHPKRMPQVWAGALAAAAERADADPDGVSEVGRKLAGAHAGAIAGSAAQLAAVTEATLAHALQEPLDPRRFLALKGLQQSLGRLPRAACVAAAAQLAPLQAELAGIPSAGPGWQALADFCAALDERERRVNGGKSPAGSALRRPGSAAKQPGRRISFKDANKRRQPRRSAAAAADAPGSGTEEGSPPPPAAPRFHAKTRRGSQAAASPAAGSPQLPPSAVLDDSPQPFDDSAPGGTGGTLPATAEEMPSGMFLAGEGEDEESGEEAGMAGARAGSDAEMEASDASVADGSEEGEEEDSQEEEEEEAEEMQRQRPRRA